MRPAVTRDGLLRDFAREAEEGEQGYTWNEAEEPLHCYYHGILLRTPHLIKSAAASDTRTAHQSVLSKRGRVPEFVVVMRQKQKIGISH